MPKLILMFRDKILAAYPLLEGEKLTIGRRVDNDIVIDNLAVSGRHAHIEHQGEHILLTDLESKNGTFCNGQPVTQCVLNNADLVSIGKHQLQADWSDTIACDPSQDACDTLPGAMNTDCTVSLELPTPAPAPGQRDAPTAVATARPEADSLAFLAGGEGMRRLPENQITIGINDEDDIVINGIWALLMGGPTAVITKQAGDYFLRFAGGWIKPKRNGAPVKGTVRLKHDDVVEVGPVRVKVQLCERQAV